MVHTPILPKKINRSQSIHSRVGYDEKVKNLESEQIFLNHILYGDLTEDIAKTLVYSDFSDRFYNRKAYIPLFLAPHHAVLGAHNRNLYFVHYQELYEKTNNMLSFLSIHATLYHSFSPQVIQSLAFSDRILHHDHRIGLRSDVVYYNIAQGKVVPEHRLVIQHIPRPLYTIRFFLNSTKETVLGDLYHPFYVFGCVALLVNPHDKRYKKTRGKEIILPITNKQVPIIPYEGVNIEGHGTRVLVPAHNREDFQIAIELGLPLDVYAFDKFGIFTAEAKEFSNKPLQEFSDNIIKYIDDISNLDQIQSVNIDEYRDKDDGTLLFPILEKNIYIGLGYHHIDDEMFVSQIQNHGSTDVLIQDIEIDEFFCISNQDELQPTITSLGGYFDTPTETQDGLCTPNLLQEIICDFASFQLLEFPAKGDDIIDAFSSTFGGELLWKSFYHYRTSQTDRVYDDQDDMYRLLSSLTEAPGTVIEHVDVLLSYIDMNSYFIHTKNGYTLKNSSEYHYDNEYIGLSLLLSQSQSCQKFSFFYNKDEGKYIKYFMHLYSYIYQKPLFINLYALASSPMLGSQWNTIQKTTTPDALRFFLLQHVVVNASEDVFALYTLEELDRFVQKRWNLSRIIPLYDLSLTDLQSKIIARQSELTDYDSYLITKLYELYDEVIFLQSKNYISQLVSVVVSTLRNDISDLLLYILQKNSSSLTELVVAYVIRFAYHILYPFIPTTVLAFLHGSGYILEEDFFTRETVCFVDKNYKCGLMLHILSQWYQEIIHSDYIHGFVLQANRDFIEYFKESYDKFIDFIGHEYVITYLEEGEEWSKEIVPHKIFTMQRGIIESQKKIVQTLPSLSILQGQLQYKQQLLQTMKNTIVRMRSSGQTEKLAQFQTQIDLLLKDIAELEYQISKLKYF